MSANRMTFDGLDALREQLRTLPADLTDDASAIIDRRAQNASGAIRAAYREGPTGHLRGGVRVSIARPSRAATAATVRSNAPHAALYEFGSQVRHNRRGANRGSMPARPTVIPIAIRERKAMNHELVELVKRAGFAVSGTP